ncbi:BRISC complex subunit FAM175B-like [Hylaeus volcanicus]|uniref:BRISC complex subunit FAM175B-like n=1 Tax=Hylaeus volcanicus TaxID=313075 RepID=UPI0023B825CC|nr:BRISC complex subunit FAM175B-like [Hylaeus volcanicus]
MADSDLLITISGAAMSLLFYENVRNTGDQMGFLLGENLEFVFKTYSDSDNQIETVKKHNNIETVISCPLPDLLHDSIGRIDKEKLKDFMRENSKQVIGWFRFRQNTDLVPTLRDNILHKEFASYFSGGNGINKEFFVMCMLSSSTTNARGTHKFKHVFLRHRKGAFEPVPLRIYNLGSRLFTHDGSDYKPTPTKKSSDRPDIFTKVIESLDLNLAKTSGLDSVITIQKTAEEYLRDLIPELCESDLEVAKLERQIKEFKLKRQAKVNGSPNNLHKNYEELNKNSVSDERRMAEKMSPPRIESPDNARDDRTRSATTSQTSILKSRNTATFTENSIARVKVDDTEIMAVKNKRFPIQDSEIVKESICKGEATAYGVGRGRGKLMYETQPKLKKPGKTSISNNPTRSNSERTLHTQVPQQESPEANCVQNTSSERCYSQIVKKKMDNTRKSDTTNNH